MEDKVTSMAIRQKTIPIPATYPSSARPLKSVSMAVRNAAEEVIAPVAIPLPVCFRVS